MVSQQQTQKAEAMKDDIVTIYCIFDDYLLSLGYRDWCNVKWSTAEVMTCLVVAMKYFYGNINRARSYLIEHGWMPQSITLGALIKRLHKVSSECWVNALKFIQEYYRTENVYLQYIVDTFPVAVCRNIRIRRCKLFQGEAYHGYNASKKEYFYGLKASVVTTTEGFPVAVMLSPGREHDITPFKRMDLNLPRGSTLYGDSAYACEEHEKERLLNDGVHMVTDRKSNSKREMALEDYVNLKYHRRTIENTFSCITAMMPRKIHATTAKGFILKIFCFILTFTTSFIANQ